MNDQAARSVTSFEQAVLHKVSALTLGEGGREVLSLYFQVMQAERTVKDRMRENLGFQRLGRRDIW